MTSTYWLTGNADNTLSDFDDEDNASDVDAIEGK